LMPTADNWPAINGNASFTVARISRAKRARSKDRIWGIAERPDVTRNDQPTRRTAAAAPCGRRPMRELRRAVVRQILLCLRPADHRHGAALRQRALGYRRQRTECRRTPVPHHRAIVLPAGQAHAGLFRGPARPLRHAVPAGVLPRDRGVLLDPDHRAGRIYSGGQGGLDFDFKRQADCRGRTGTEGVGRPNLVGRWRFRQRQHHHQRQGSLESRHQAAEDRLASRCWRRMDQRPDRQCAAAVARNECRFLGRSAKRAPQVHAEHVFDRAHGIVHIAAAFRAVAESLLRLQEAAVHGTSDRGDAQPCVPDAVHAGSGAAGRSAPSGCTPRRLAGDTLQPALGGGMDLDFRVLVADAEARLPARLVHDQREILEPGLLLHDPARRWLRIRHAAQFDQRMILYTVELEMDSALRDEYLAWLGGHVREMLALPGFTGAEILIRSEPPPPAGRFIVQAHYRLRDRAAWDSYLAHHAPRMREAGLARFGERVHASRAILESP